MPAYPEPSLRTSTERPALRAETFASIVRELPTNAKTNDPWIRHTKCDDTLGCANHPDHQPPFLRDCKLSLGVCAHRAQALRRRSPVPTEPTAKQIGESATIITERVLTPVGAL